MKNIIFIAGAPASGKSTAKDAIGGWLEDDKYSVIHMSDKEELLRVVENEMKGKTPNRDGSLESEHTILLDPAKPRESWGMVFKTAYALNHAHDEMFAAIADLSRENDPGRIILAEIAYGEDAVYPKGRLRQSANEFIAQFIRHRIINNMLLLDIQASLEFRRPRNDDRRKPGKTGYIPDPEFVKYFGDKGGFGPQEKRLLDGRYMNIKNEEISFAEFMQALAGQYDNFILPGIRGEGQQTSPEFLNQRTRR